MAYASLTGGWTNRDASSRYGGLAVVVWYFGGKSSDYLLAGAAALIVHYLLAEFAGMYTKALDQFTGRGAVRR